MPCIALRLKLEFLWGGVGGGGGANQESCQTHNQVALGCFWVGLLLLGLALGFGFSAGGISMPALIGLINFLIFIYSNPSSELSMHYIKNEGGLMKILSSR